jgi:hypothetical protein
MKNFALILALLFVISFTPGIEARSRTSAGSGHHIKRSSTARHQFMKQTGYPNGRPGYIIDHVIPLKRGGPDTPGNMQWQTRQEAREKDKWE